MAKKFKGNNAKIVGDTRLTQREMKKFAAAYHNVQRDQQIALEARLAQNNFQSDLQQPAILGDTE